MAWSLRRRPLLQLLLLVVVVVAVAVSTLHTVRGDGDAGAGAAPTVGATTPTVQQTEVDASGRIHSVSSNGGDGGLRVRPAARPDEETVGATPVKPREQGVRPPPPPPPPRSPVRATTKPQQVDTDGYKPTPPPPPPRPRATTAAQQAAAARSDASRGPSGGLPPGMPPMPPPPPGMADLRDAQNRPAHKMGARRPGGPGGPPPPPPEPSEPVMPELPPELRPKPKDPNAKPRPQDIGVGHRVKRGPDWRWGDQDGGKGGVGTVIEIKRWKGEQDPLKFGVRVRWERTKAINLYRWGVDGAYDLEVIGYSDPAVAKSYIPPPVLPTPTFTLDKSALMHIYSETDGRRWTVSKGWNTPDSDPCLDRWTGVTCEKGRVIALDLSNLHISSPWPPSLSKLEMLQTLNLAFNRITGTIPDSLVTLEHLKWIAIHDNQLTGSIPNGIGRLQNLEWFVAFNNQLSGTLPEDLGQCKKLRQLMLQNNALQGTIPASLGNLQELEVLYLERNPFMGVVPKSINQLPKLKRRRIPTGVLDEE